MYTNIGSHNSLVVDEQFVYSIVIIHNSFNTQEDTPDNLESGGNKKGPTAKKFKKIKLHKIDTVHFILFIIFMAGIYCSKFAFKSLYNWKNFQCKPGFYDVLEDVDILKCEG